MKRRGGNETLGFTVKKKKKKKEQRITNDDAGKFGSRSDLYGVLLVNRNKTLIGHEMRP